MCNRSGGANCNGGMPPRSTFRGLWWNDLRPRRSFDPYWTVTPLNGYEHAAEKKDSCRIGRKGVVYLSFIKMRLHQTKGRKPERGDTMSRMQVREIERTAFLQVGEITQNIRQSAWPKEFQRHVNSYDQLDWARSHYLWQWGWVLLTAKKPGFTLSCVPERAIELCARMKLNLVMLTTIADDVADELKDDDLMKEILGMQLERDRVDSFWKARHETHPVIKLLASLLDETVAILSGEPYWEKMRDIFFYDMKQLWNALDHAYLMGKHPEVINYEESQTYSAHNMIFHLFADVDLICSESFDLNDLPQMRSIVHYAQRMGRIGNWVATWEREIVVGDLTSGLISLMLSKRLLTVDELWEVCNAENAKDLVKLAKDALLEEELFTEWEELRELVLGYRHQVQSVDVEAYVDGLEFVTCYYFASRGLV